jgi:hypothetical protein
VSGTGRAASFAYGDAIEAISQLAPDQVVHAEKCGLSAADAEWFHGESIPFVEHRLFAGRALLDQTA